jgi:hypothetical protein
MTLLTERVTTRNNARTKTATRRDQIRRLSDANLAELRRVLEAEATRRRNETVEGIYQENPAHRIRWWRPCPICRDRACRSQGCRDIERRSARL